MTRGFLCAKVAKYLDRVYSPDRVLYPMRRVGAKGPVEGQRSFAPPDRGQRPGPTQSKATRSKTKPRRFGERISDEALDEITARFRATAGRVWE